jgi:hypothetical protein
LDPGCGASPGTCAGFSLSGHSLEKFRSDSDVLAAGFCSSSGYNGGLACDVETHDNGFTIDVDGIATRCEKNTS